MFKLPPVGTCPDGKSRRCEHDEADACATPDGTGLWETMKCAGNVRLKDATSPSPEVCACAVVDAAALYAQAELVSTYVPDAESPALRKYESVGTLAMPCLPSPAAAAGRRPLPRRRPAAASP